MNATQMNIVLWMNAAVGAVAIARPLKNSTNGTLPPITAIASTPRRARGGRVMDSRRAPSRSAIETRTMAATAFLAVVYTAASETSFTPNALR